MTSRITMGIDRVPTDHSPIVRDESGLATSHASPCAHAGSHRVRLQGWSQGGTAAYECEGCLAHFAASELVRLPRLYQIATDAATTEVYAADSNEAARRFARSEGIRGIDGAWSLAYYLDRAGGYGTMTGPDGLVFQVARAAL